MRTFLAGLLAIIVLVAIGFAVWEPLSATSQPAPPAHTYDSVIARDRYGVPHIFGKTDPDVAYGRRLCPCPRMISPRCRKRSRWRRGRLGAMTGADGAKVDYTLALLGARETEHRDYDKQPADVRALLDGYASGLNAFARRHPEEVRLAKLFPANGEDIATGFVLRTPFFLRPRPDARRAERRQAAAARGCRGSAGQPRSHRASGSPRIGGRGSDAEWLERVRRRAESGQPTGSRA